MPRRSFLLVVTLLGAAAQSPRESSIVTPGWLHQRLREPGLVILEVSWAPAETAKDYLAGHIPGAIHLNTDDFENGYPRWHLRPIPELHATIGRHGITAESTVLVYGSQSVAAARAWWVLRYAGVRDVRYLDGGLAAWARAGYPITTEPRAPIPATFRTSPRDPILATTAYVRQHLRTAVLADVRGVDEYQGLRSGYSYLEAKGRIPGALLVHDAGDRAGVYQNPDGTLRALADIRRLWQSAGLLDGNGIATREIIFYCGGGWRSSLAFLYAHEMGIAGIRNYSDGWVGWSTKHEAVPGHGGITPGWRQSPSGNPVEPGAAR